MSPFFSLIFSAICLAEKATFRQVLVLTLALAFSMGFIFSGDAEIDQNGLSASDSLLTKTYAWTILMLTPVM